MYFTRKYMPSRSRYGIRSDPLLDRTAHFSARRSMWIRHDCLTGSYTYTAYSSVMDGMSCMQEKRRP